MQQPQSKPKPGYGATLRRWSRGIHRELSFFFAGVIIIYSVSGIVLNHKKDFNSNYSISRSEIQLQGGFPALSQVDKAFAVGLMKQVGERAKDYTKHHYFGESQMKIFIKGGSSLDVDMNSGKALYESVKKRPVISQMNRLHYNPNRWWTYFSDFFAVSLILITITGLVMIKGRKGFWGRGGVEFVVGVIIPVIFLFLLK